MIFLKILFRKPGSIFVDLLIVILSLSLFLGGDCTDYTNISSLDQFKSILARKSKDEDISNDFAKLVHDRSFILKDFARYELIISLIKMRNYHEGLNEAIKFGILYPESPLFENVALLRLGIGCRNPAESLCKEELIATKDMIGKSDFDSYIYYEAINYFYTNDLINSYNRFKELYYSYPVSKFSNEAKLHIDLIKNMRSSDINILDPDIDEKIKRIEILLGKLIYKDAKEETIGLYHSVKNKKEKARILYLYASILQKERNYKESLIEYEIYIKRYKDQPMVDSVLYNMAVINWNMDNDKKAISYLKQLIKMRSADKALKVRAYNILGDIYGSNNNLKESEKYYKESIKFSMFLNDTDCNWDLIWLFYRNQLYSSATEEFLNLLRNRKIYDLDDRLIYFGLKSARLGGLIDKVSDIDLGRINFIPPGFYQLIYKARINETDINDIYLANKIEDIEIVDPKDDIRAILKTRGFRNSKEQHVFERIVALEYVGLKEWAVLEADRFAKNIDTNIYDDIILTGFIYNSLGAYHETVGMLRYLPRDIQLSYISDKRLWRLYFPVVYWDRIKSESAIYDIDPFLILAIMRQESLFNPNATSSSNARGLMQMIPATGKKIYELLDLEQKTGNRFDQSILYNPDTNIKLAVKLVSSLLRKYDNKIIYILAAYNAGDKAVGKWINRSNHLSDDDFIESVSYKETSKYIKLVMRNLILYHAIYDESFKTRYDIGEDMISKKQ